MLDDCFTSVPPSSSSSLSSFCESYLHSTPGTITQYSTITLTTTSKTIKTFTVPTSCSTTITISAFPTEVFYSSRSTVPGPSRKRKVEQTTSIPPQPTAGCQTSSGPPIISSACKCYLTSPTVTATSTRQFTTTGLSIVVVPVCTFTDTVTVAATPLSCGVSNPTTTTSGTITCTQSNVPTSTNARFRIEGGDEGTIFEDCISSQGEVITTPSGGSHECNGPGATATTQIDAAAKRDNFTFDGTYSTKYQDFSITSIAETTETDTQFWGILQDLVYTPKDGCGTALSTNGVQETLWAFNASNQTEFLKIVPDFAVIAVGTTSYTISVVGTNGYGAAFFPVTDALVPGAVHVSNGTYEIYVPSTPGCYQYKAFASSAIRSNAFYLTVLPF